jgi:hypothetical protein
VEKQYPIDHINSIGTILPVGGVCMMENKQLTLQFRVVALVSAEGSPADKAKALFKTFTDNNVLKYLNENSLNQAGYFVELENKSMFDALDTADLDNYLYAFDKADWANKKYFITQKQVFKLDAANNKILKAGSTTAYEMETVPVENIFYNVEVDTGKVDAKEKPIKETKSPDYVFTEAYTAKLAAKMLSYTGGLIILCDYECAEEGIAAFSRVTPADHKKVFVYNISTGKGANYAHEIGHMLGLKHTFFDEADKKEHEKNKAYVVELDENLEDDKRKTSNTFELTNTKMK